MVHIFMPPNTISGVLNPAGRPAEALVAASETRLRELAPEIRREVLVQAAMICEIRRHGEPALFGLRDDVSEAALRITELAAHGGLEAMGEVARGLRALIDAHSSQGLWREDALDLHLDCLDLLARDQGLAPGEALALVHRLQGVRAAIGLRDDGPARDGAG